MLRFIVAASRATPANGIECGYIEDAYPPGPGRLVQRAQAWELVFFWNGAQVLLEDLPF